MSSVKICISLVRLVEIEYTACLKGVLESDSALWLDGAKCSCLVCPMTIQNHMLAPPSGSRYTLQISTSPTFRKKCFLLLKIPKNLKIFKKSENNFLELATFASSTALSATTYTMLATIHIILATTHAILDMTWFFQLFSLYMKKHHSLKVIFRPWGEKKWKNKSGKWHVLTPPEWKFPLFLTKYCLPLYKRSWNW